MKTKGALVWHRYGGLQGGLLGTLVDIVGLSDDELTAIATVSVATVRRAGREDS